MSDSYLEARKKVFFSLLKRTPTHMLVWVLEVAEDGLRERLKQSQMECIRLRDFGPSPYFNSEDLTQEAALTKETQSVADYTHLLELVCSAKTAVSYFDIMQFGEALRNSGLNEAIKEVSKKAAEMTRARKAKEGKK